MFHIVWCQCSAVNRWERRGRGDIGSHSIYLLRWPISVMKPLFSGNHQTPACWLVWTAINSKFFALLGFPYSPPPHWGGENYSMGLTCCCRLNCHMWWRQTAPLSALLHRSDRAVQLSALVQTIGFTIKWWLNKVNLTHRHRHKTSRPLPCRICRIQHSHKRSTLCSIKTWHLLVLEKTFFVIFLPKKSIISVRNNLS